MTVSANYIAFSGTRLLAKGKLSELAPQLKRVVDQESDEAVLLFDCDTGRQFDLDLSGTVEQVAARYRAKTGQDSGVKQATGNRRGRPRLGVVGREVTLLPRHWEWLDNQRSGASAQLRLLVDQARKASTGEDEIRLAQDSANRFMFALAGNENGFEEAVRALYARDKTGFERETAKWPKDIRDCARQFAEMALREQA